MNTEERVIAIVYHSLPTNCVTSINEGCLPSNRTNIHSFPIYEKAK